jgi:uncharacterized membrane protein
LWFVFFANQKRTNARFEGNQMLKKVLSIIVSVVVAFLIVIAFEWLGHRIWPLPAGMDWKNTAEVASFMANMPLPAYLWLLLGWVVALCAGVWSCSRKAGTAVKWPIWVTAALFLMATATNFFVLPHPMWFVVTAAIVMALATWAALKFSSHTSGGR